MAISSINIQTATAHSFKHNDRTDTPSYLVDSPSLNECNLGHEEAQNILNNYVKEAEKYRKDNGLRAMKKDTIKSVEAVVNLNASHTLKDVEKLAKTIEKEFGFRAVQIAVHRDEGKDTKNKNYHAHIVMCILTPEGKTIQRTLGRDGLKKLQDITAKELWMVRGKEGSKAERLDHKQYRAVAQEREDIAYSFREYQKRITALEIENTEQKKELHRLNTQVNKGNATVQELEKQLSEALESKNTPETIKDTPKVVLNDFRPISVPTITKQTVEVKTGMFSSEKQEVLPLEQAKKLVDYANAVSEQNKKLHTQNNELKAENFELQKYKKSYRELIAKLKEYTKFEKISEIVEAIKERFIKSPIEQIREYRENKQNEPTIFEKLNKEVAEIHKENPSIKAEVEKKPLGQKFVPKEKSQHRGFSR
jgi:uncharacterized coiled-coil protein SlyX